MSNNIGYRIQIDGLPDEIKEQLNIYKKRKRDRIVAVIDDLYGGIANIDEIFVGVYLKYNKILKRKYVANKVYKLSKSGFLYKIKGNKGIYTTDEELQDCSLKDTGN